MKVRSCLQLIALIGATLFLNAQETTIQGHVISARTGTPVEGAEIQAFEAYGKGLFVAKSDSSGVYRLANLSPGYYLLSCSRADYVTAHPGQSHRRGEPRNPMPLMAGTSIHDLDFRLEENASIAGTITGEDGKPLPGISVVASDPYFTQGSLHLEPHSLTRSDSQGHYRIIGLPAGRYYVHATKVNGPSGYAASFYPNATSLQGAQNVRLTIGANLENIDLKLKKAPAFAVSGHIEVAYATRSPKAVFTINALPESGAAGVLGQVGAKGDFHFAGLIPGRYRLVASMTDLTTGAHFEESKRFEVAQSEVQGLTVILGTAATVRVNVHFADGETPFAVALTLRPRRSPDTRRSMAILRANSEDGTHYGFRQVPADDYFLALEPNSNINRVALLQEVKVDGKDALEEGFTVPNGAVTLEADVTISRHGSMLQGTLEDAAGKPLPARPIVLAPTDHAKRQFRRYTSVAWTDGLGQFKMNNVIPGDYFIVLWKGDDPGEAQDPTLFEEVDRNGKPVTLKSDTAFRITMKSQ